jgi:transposase
VQRRTAQINQIRGLLLEYGIEVAPGRAAIQRRLPAILEDADNGLSERFHPDLHALADELRHLNERVAHYDDQIAQGDVQARSLMTIPGLRAKGATALLAAVGEDPQLLQNGRGLAAWLGLVSRQHSTGGRERLLGVSKRGDAYLRNLLIHGARAVRRCIERKDGLTSRWATALKARRHPDVAVVVMTNKIARMAYAVIVTGKPYDPAKAALANG